MFCVEVKDVPGTFYVDKKSFEQITANAEHHLVENLKVGTRLTAQTKVQNPSTEEPLGTPSMDDVDDSTGIVAAEPDFRPVESGVMNREKETALGTPALFGETN